MSKGKEQKPVILQVLPELDHGGVEVGTVQIADALRQHGIKNFVASAGDAWCTIWKNQSAPYYAAAENQKSDQALPQFAEAGKIIKENGINIVHARSRAPAWSAYWAAKRAGVKFMTTFHGTYGLGPKGIKKFYNRVMTYGQLVIAISNHIKKHITENYRINEDKIRLIHRCVDIEKFSPAAVSQERIIRAVQENNIPEDLPVISLIGRITRWKGQHVLLEALSKLKDRDFFCLIVGSDQGRVKYTEELKELVKKYGLESKVKFIGQSFDIPALLMVSDIVLSTAVEPEAFGRAAIEGQAMGKIVIASNLGGSLENTIDGVTGKLYESSDPQALADAIRWALDLPLEEKKKISAAAIKNVKENFTKQIMCDKTIAVYNELINMD